jgi:hypothetical protein
MIIFYFPEGLILILILFGVFKKVLESIYSYESMYGGLQF